MLRSLIKDAKLEHARVVKQGIDTRNALKGSWVVCGYEEDKAICRLQVEGTPLFPCDCGHVCGWGC